MAKLPQVAICPAMSPEFQAKAAAFHTTRWTRVCAAK